MSSKCILTMKSGIDITQSRPNIIISDTRDLNASSCGELSKILMREEINVCTADNAAGRLRELCPNGSWHMVVIHDGGLSSPAFAMVEKIRRFSDVPVLMISDDCSEIYKIMALSKGADACMNGGKDFCVYEFKARVVAMLRRYLGINEGCITIHESRDTLTNGGLTIDRRRREVFSEGIRVRMTAIEYGIVEYLMENCGDVCTVDDIYRRVWNENPYSVRKTVVEHIRRIRSKIEPDPHNPCYIKVVFGVGYKMERAV